MATPTRIALMNEIDSFAQSIQKVSTWNGTNKPFGHIVSTTKDNYVYEFWCYLKILIEINKDPNQHVKIVTGSGKFPAAPASKKKNWSYYEVWDSKNNLLYIVCAGTGVKRSDASGTIHHPDISFQKPTAPIDDDPTGNDIEIILDAKYMYPEKKDGSPKKIGKIKINLLSEFGHIVEVLLRTRKNKKTSLNFGLLSELNANALLSNAFVQRKHSEACKVDCIKQIGEFEIGKTYMVIP